MHFPDVHSHVLNHLSLWKHGDKPNPVGVKYRFFRTPDGEDYFYKLAVACKYTTLIGTCVGVHDIGAQQKFVDPVFCAYRFIKFTAFGFACGAVYTTIYTCLGSMRNKDDQYNHLAAGFGTGAMFGLWHKGNFASGPLWGIPWALFFCACKYNICRRKEDPFGASKDTAAWSNYFHDLQDWAVYMDDPPKTWTTGIEETPTVLPDRRGF